MLTNQGPRHEQFVQQLKEYLGVPEATLFVNGHIALELAIRGLGLKGEVITTPYSFASTCHAISMNGLTPVFCDIREDTFVMDEEKIEALITENTCAILPVHVYGYPCNVEAIAHIAKKHHLKVIYDAAHAFGVRINGQPIGNFGDVSMFSFHATKVFHTIEGGALTYADPALKRNFDLVKNFGISGPESIEQVGMNGKMNEFQAAMGLVNLRHVDGQIQNRKACAQRYHKRLEQVNGLRLIGDMDGVTHNYSYFPVLIEAQRFGMSRDELHARLEKREIYTRKYFYPLITQYECYREACLNVELPVAALIASQILTLPMYGSLSQEEVDQICGVIIEIQSET